MTDKSNALQIRTLRSEDLPAIITIHQEVFPDYVSTLAGPFYLRQLYGTFIKDTNCMALGAFLDDRLAGIANGHGNRKAFHRAVFGRSYLTMATLLGWRFLLNNHFRKKAWRRRGVISELITGQLVQETGQPDGGLCPIRLVSLAVGLKHQRQGIAKSLVEEYCQRWANTGAGCVGLSVFRNNRPAIAFYERTGWVREHETEESIYYRRDMVRPDDEVIQERLAVAQRYQRRTERAAELLYSPLLPHVYLGLQERQRALIRWIRTCGLEPLNSRRVLEVGCGSGGALLDLHRLGFAPESMTANELLPERAAAARHHLPAAVRVLTGDACEIPLSEGPFDIVVQSTVFTSILKHDVQQRLADRMWALAKPGGGVLWYDFIYNNPGNPDVRGVPLRHIRALFPQGQITVWRLTLAPPVARMVTRIHPTFYSWFNLVPWLRTHVLCWIRKPVASASSARST